jgi:hypothetical protein
VIATVVAWSAWSSKDADALSIGSFIILAFTLIMLVWYAYDTNSIARVTRERWMREGILSTTYSIELTGEKGQSGRTMFRVHNLTTLVVRTRISCNFRLYGDPIEADPLYDGQETWLIFPQQVSQGWFDIQSLLQKKERT